ncbi:MAG: ABC transporter ATP-binding protein [Vicinamibacteria bacterium]
MTGAAEDDRTTQTTDWRLLLRLLRYLRPYVAPTLAAFGLIVVMAGLDLAGPYITKIAIDEVIAPGRADLLPAVAGLYLLVLTLGFAVRSGQVFLLQITGQRIVVDLRREIFAHLQKLHVGHLDKNPVGRLMTRVTTDVDAINELFTSGVVTVFGDLFTLAGIMAVMLSLNWKLALVTFAVLPFFFAVTDWFRRGARTSFREVRALVARLNSFMQENLAGMAVVQLFRREARNRQAFSAINRDHMDANLKAIFYYAVFYPAIDLLAAVAIALILWYGGGRVLDGALTLGALVAFVQYSERFWRPISDLSEKFNIVQAAMASSERIFGLLDTEPAIVAPAEPRALREVRGRIAFENVWFAYDGESWVLRDVSFVVEPGTTVALVGATGAGKTSVISLLLRFYDPQRGRITLDGADIRELDPRALRAATALVLQDVHIFSGSMASNIRLGSPIPDARVRAAAEAVHLSRYIEALAGGYDAPVRERGATLSVGQKQLLSFARALAHEPRVLILDEATSSVDTETEGLIQDALRVLLAGRTAVVIAHRLSTIQSADQILVLHKGKVRERGTHAQLLQAAGIYSRLHALQYQSLPLSAS